jgi:hypothetical protein
MHISPKCLLHIFFLLVFNSACCQVLEWVLLYYMCCPMIYVSSKGPKKIAVSLRSPKDGNRSSFYNVVFSSYLEFWTMDKFQKPGDSISLLSCLE